MHSGMPIWTLSLLSSYIHRSGCDGQDIHLYKRHDSSMKIFKIGGFWTGLVNTPCSKLYKHARVYVLHAAEAKTSPWKVISYVHTHSLMQYNTTCWSMGFLLPETPCIAQPCSIPTGIWVSYFMKLNGPAMQYIPTCHATVTCMHAQCMVHGTIMQCSCMRVPADPAL